jgi:hypothetical protein
MAALIHEVFGFASICCKVGPFDTGAVDEQTSDKFIGNLKAE